MTAADPERLAAEMGVTLEEAADRCPASSQWSMSLTPGAEAALKAMGCSFEEAAAAAAEFGAALRRMEQAWLSGMDRERLDRAGIRPPLQGDERAEHWRRVLDPNRTRPR